MKFTAALELENNWHITLCFCDANKRLGKVKTWHDSSSVISGPQKYIIFEHKWAPR